MGRGYIAVVVVGAFSICGVLGLRLGEHLCTPTRIYPVPDLNNDGKSDMVAESRNSRTVYLQDEHGNFIPIDDFYRFVENRTQENQRTELELQKRRHEEEKKRIEDSLKPKKDNADIGVEF